MFKNDLSSETPFLENVPYLRSPPFAYCFILAKYFHSCYFLHSLAAHSCPTSKTHTFSHFILFYLYFSLVICNNFISKRIINNNFLCNFFPRLLQRRRILFEFFFLSTVESWKSSSANECWLQESLQERNKCDYFFQSFRSEWKFEHQNYYVNACSSQNRFSQVF